MDYFIIKGGRKLSGEITVNTSKNAAVALLAASLINRGRTVLKDVPQIEEVNRWLEVMRSIGVKIERNDRTLTIQPPERFRLEQIDKKAAGRTRSVILLIGALSGRLKKFRIPQAGGCRLGSRTVRPHLYALEDLGISVETSRNDYVVDARSRHGAEKSILYESGDTVTENALLAAAQIPGRTEIRFATSNYMVRDLCYFLQKLGVKIRGIGTSTLVVEGSEEICRNVSFSIGEDPIEAMLFVSLAVVTKSELTVKRCPIDFLELELERLRRMGLSFTQSAPYRAKNGKTVLVDLVIHPSKLRAAEDKIHALPFPGINMDNLPFFVPIACVSKGQTMIHDWVYENRAVYFSELNRLGAKITLLDPHRVLIDGPVRFRSAEMVCPPALRPAALLLVAMLAARGTSILRNIYPIQRGYENLPERLARIGADIRLERDKCRR